MIIKIVEHISELTEVVTHQIVVKVADYYVGKGSVLLETVQEKGDLIVGNGENDVPRLPAGSDGQVLVARPGEASGLAYETLSRPGDNYIINGDFKRAARGTSFAAVANGVYTLDGWSYRKSGSMEHTISKVSGVPTFAQSGHTSTSSMKVECTADASIANTDYCMIQSVIEGVVYAELKGQTATLSFWVRATKTGTYCVSFVANSSGTIRSHYIAEYVIYVANTWEKKTITLNLNHPDGVFLAGNWGLLIGWVLACGASYQSTPNLWQGFIKYATANQINACDMVGNTWQISQVKLEIGSNATVYTPTHLFGGEDWACERYCFGFTTAAYGTIGYGQAINTAACSINIFLQTPMCKIPTLSSLITASDWVLTDGVGSAIDVTGFSINTKATQRLVIVDTSVSSGLTQYRQYWLRGDTAGERKFILEANLV